MPVVESVLFGYTTPAAATMAPGRNLTAAYIIYTLYSELAEAAQDADLTQDTDPRGQLIACRRDCFVLQRRERLVVALDLACRRCFPALSVWSTASSESTELSGDAVTLHGTQFPLLPYLWGHLKGSKLGFGLLQTEYGALQLIGGLFAGESHLSDLISWQSDQC